MPTTTAAAMIPPTMPPVLDEEDESETVFEQSLGYSAYVVEVEQHDVQAEEAKFHIQFALFVHVRQVEYLEAQVCSSRAAAAVLFVGGAASAVAWERSRRRIGERIFGQAVGGDAGVRAA